MDREKIRYLADLSAVRSYASTLLNSGFSSVRKELNFLSSKIIKLDEEFIKVLKEALVEHEVSELKTVKLTEKMSEALSEISKEQNVEVKPELVEEQVETSVVETVDVPSSLVRDKELLDEALVKAKQDIKPKRSYKKVKKIAESGD